MPFLAKQHSRIPTEDILSWSIDSPQYDLDKPVYIDAANPQRTISARQGRSLIRKLAAGLRKQGLKKGDCVVVASFNDLYYPILALGIIAAGGVFTGTNPGYTSFEVAHHINIVHGRFIITEPEILKPILDAKHDVPKSNIFIFDSQGQAIPEGFKGWKTLLEYGEEDWPRFDDFEKSKSTIAMLLFSSGTTGLPKAVQLSHHNLISQHTLVFEHQPVPYPIRRLLALPIFHAATTPSGVITPFRSGNVTYIMRRFDLEGFLSNIQKYQISELIVVPPIAIGIIMSPLGEKYSLKSVKRALCGAAPLDKGPQARLQALLAPDAPCTQVWGMTETSCIASMFTYPEGDDTGSVGRMLPNLDVKLIDDEGKDVSNPGVRGEICIRGPTLTKGYFENPEANSRDWDQEGYFKTGDIGYMNDQGFWYIVDRKKELIKVRGFQVAPPELEAVLLSHPSIIDAAVIGIPTSSADGELPRAYVVQRPGTPKLSEQEVIEYSAGKLAKYKRLDGGIKFVDAIPKTASGKILKRELREWAKKEVRSKI
ncbi:acetyl-CoA synthetase-like protein [Zopfia rhizophila CBS 207.26]|uniref:Acetyl-CoA synthetase-like protein n=1 Tax=Zopfia rhizophila CBS 207.26 TaxID=1314779 RepID=A0A6A6EQV0_9PEZI|nr:acetyl-CoA synthetase-like protein [Zopfia rhizophila CBS 207.26]